MYLRWISWISWNIWHLQGLIMECTQINYVTSIIVFMHDQILYWFRFIYQGYVAIEIYNYIFGATIIFKKQEAEWQNLS